MTERLNIAFQMDPLDTLNPLGDSTLMLIEEAQKRGHKVFHYLVDHLSYNRGKVISKAHEIEIDLSQTPYFQYKKQVILDLGKDIDIIFMRQDPPFDMAYITATHILDLIKDQTAIINDPTSVRNAPEKLLITYFPDLIPPTLISRDKQEIESFWEDYEDIIVKPLFAMGGQGVFRLKKGDNNLQSLLEIFFNQSREPLIIQKFLPEVVQGDKRIILAGGEPIGAINRVPEEGQIRSNMVVGGSAEQSILTERDQEICQKISQCLKDNHLDFVGIDVIGPYLTEINVTSPTGLRSIESFDGSKPQAKIMDCAEKRYNDLKLKT